MDKVTEDKLFGLSTNNLSLKRDFSKFVVSEVANFRNYRFKDKTGSKYYQTGKECLASSKDRMESPAKDVDEGQDTTKV